MGSPSLKRCPPIGRERYLIRFTTSTVNAAVARNILEEQLPKPDAPRAIRATSLLDVLSPLSDSSVELNDFDRVRVAVDGTMWSASVDVLDRGSTPLPVSVDPEERDSHQTPGVQVADLVANTVRHHYVDGSYESAVSTIEEVLAK